jgi:transposase-like protein
MELAISASLSPAQAQVALSLASGASVTHAAQSAGVGRTTVYEWRKHNPDFSSAIDQAKAEYAATLRDQLRDLSVKALSTLEALLDDPKTPASVRLKAALAVLNRPRFPKQAWNLPEKIGSSQAMDEVVRTEPNTSEEENEFLAPLPSRRFDKVGRNEPRPCGSGQKYKKCCLNLPSAHCEPIMNPGNGLSRVERPAVGS